MHEHLVDHNLGKERREETKQLEKKGCNKYFAEERSIFDEGGNEPGEIELQIL